ncbi:Hypothetical_protein [Hexamita inflata]|uniref:Hypothetical_protein n=1 Tax=Hexamita inflata TaxID=28002 RepID=A0AA86P2L7_9EUKA|nr:Hypothetical protein HINF_LOCUS16672 [Hexamita inflata]
MEAIPSDLNITIMAYGQTCSAIAFYLAFINQTTMLNLTNKFHINCRYISKDYLGCPGSQYDNMCSPWDQKEYRDTEYILVESKAILNQVRQIMNQDPYRKVRLFTKFDTENEQDLSYLNENFGLISNRVIQNIVDLWQIGKLK